ncbi:hypothetical protein [Streptococcus gallolyticus]|uniref:Uncharacterized protein n=1 Tax=Streptococcus gallolyticus TaxID=315405 RepID=A0A1H9V9I7_9STRE|nr:hypothetical protein [Streptococcus gallolyticus]SES18228.1 hypothetical protein SAMN04487840_12111 [Streptococcus gallolyticus]
MPLYQATKNLHFKSLDKSVIVDEVVELEQEYADQVNADLAKVFPGTKAVLVPFGEEAEKPKRTRKKATADE